MNEHEVTQMLNQILKDMFYKILRLQSKSISDASGDSISRSEMHVIDLVDSIEGATMSDIANRLGISKATASVTISTLVKKEYIKKTKSQYDKRKVLLALTEKGKYVSGKHQQFHDMMVQSVLKEFKIEEYPEVLRSIQALQGFFECLEN